MHHKVNSRAILPRDSREDCKRLIFQSLNELAKYNDIAIIYQLYELVRHRDSSVSMTESRAYQSRGPVGKRGLCLFCGKRTRNSGDNVRLGNFIADPWCYYDFKQTIGVSYLESADNRPPVIVVPIHFPGSIDNAILDLAWGLAAHRFFGRSHLKSPASLTTKTGTDAMKLVRQIKRRQITHNGN
jgi:hypothetical protein